MKLDTKDSSTSGANSGVNKLTTIVAIYDVSSVQRLVDAARIVYGMGYQTFVAVKVYGAATQNGIPEVAKMAIREKKSFHVLASLDDLIELFEPEKLVIISREYGEPVNREELVKIISGNKLVILVGGSETSITRKEASKATTIYPSFIPGYIGPLGELAIILYLASSK